MLFRWIEKIKKAVVVSQSELDSSTFATALSDTNYTVVE